VQFDEFVVDEINPAAQLIVEDRAEFFEGEPDTTLRSQADLRSSRFFAGVSCLLSSRYRDSAERPSRMPPRRSIRSSVPPNGTG
jgi:hypothetical protein